MKQHLQEVLSLIHQNSYIYYPKKIFVYFSEGIAYIFAIGFIVLGYWVDSIISKYFDLTFAVICAISENKTTYDQYDNFKLGLKAICIIVALIFIFYGRRLRAHRKFRTNVKIAERKLDAIIEEHNKVMNEID